VVEPDRPVAIANAYFLSATPNEWFLCWKGHESYQNISGINIILTDKEEARKR